MKDKTTNLLRLYQILMITAIVVLVVTYSLVIYSLIHTSWRLEGSDFLAYYSAGRVSREFGLSNVYNSALEAAAQAEITGLPYDASNFLPPNHPPVLYPVLTLLARFDYRTALMGYALLLAVLVLCGLPAVYFLLRQNGWSQRQTWLMLVGVVLFEPLFISLFKGQDSALLLLGGLLWFYGLNRSDDRLAGLGLSLTLIRPQVAIVLAIPFLFKRRKVFGWFCVGAAALGLYSFILVGMRGVKDYMSILKISANGQGFGMGEANMFNFTGLLLRLFPGLNSNILHVLSWGLFAACCIALCVIWSRSKEINVFSIGLAVILSLFAAPHLHYHDLVFLLIPLIGLGLAWMKAGKKVSYIAASLPIIASVIFLLADWWDPLRWTFPFFLMISLPALTWFVGRSHEAG
jgi:hypothetical protein